MIFLIFGKLLASISLFGGKDDKDDDKTKVAPSPRPRGNRGGGKLKQFFYDIYFDVLKYYITFNFMFNTNYYNQIFFYFYYISRTRVFC